MNLRDVYKIRQELRDDEARLKQLRDDSGVTELEKKVSSTKKYLESLCGDLAAEGRTQEGSLRIVNVGRSVRRVNIERLQQYDNDAYECLTGNLTLPVGVVEKFFEAYPNKSDIMVHVCDTELYPKYDIVDVLEGD